MSQSKVSVIIPAYNAQKTLSRCLDSLVNQTLKDIEIIVINDGSKDNTLNICNTYKEKYPNIVIITQENMGVSASRNNALKIAGGEYIGFCDADDFVDCDMYQKLFKAAKEQSADIVCCGYSRDILGMRRYTYPNHKTNVRFDKQYINDEILCELFYEREGKTSGMLSVCNKIYKRKLITDNNIFFPTVWKNAEDVNFNVHNLINADSITFIAETPYHYVKPLTRKSITSSVRPGYFDVHLRYQRFLEDTIGKELGISYDNDEGYLLYITKAERNALEVYTKEKDEAEKEKWLRCVFDSEEYRKSLAHCSEELMSPAQLAQKQAVLDDNFDGFKSAIASFAGDYKKSQRKAKIDRIKRLFLRR